MKYITSIFAILMMSLTVSAHAGEKENMSLQQLIGVSETPYDFSEINNPEGRGRAMARGANGGGMKVRGGGRAGRMPRAR